MNNPYRFLAALMIAWVATVATQATEVVATPAPDRGISGNCRIVEVYDGDTVTIVVEVPVRVRLLDDWSPEVKTRDKNEKALGYASRDHLAQMIGGMEFRPTSKKDPLAGRWVGDAEGRFFVPTQGARSLSGVITLGRVLAHLWTRDDLTQSLSEKQVEAGHAFRTKPELEKALGVGKR